MLKLWLPLALFVTACATPLTPLPYRALIDNHLALTRKPLPAATIGTFTSQVDYEPMCRGVGKILPQPSVEVYLRDALALELTLANLVADNAPVKLEGEVTGIAFKPKIAHASWRLALRVRSSNGRTLEVERLDTFRSAFFGDTACEIVSDHFMSTVQLLIRDVVLSPAFPSLLAPPAATPES